MIFFQADVPGMVQAGHARVPRATCGYLPPIIAVAVSTIHASPNSENIPWHNPGVQHYLKARWSYTNTYPDPIKWDKLSLKKSPDGMYWKDSSISTSLLPLTSSAFELD